MKSDVLSDTPFKSPEFPEANKMNGGKSKITTFATNSVTPVSLQDM